VSASNHGKDTMKRLVLTACAILALALGGTAASHAQGTGGAGSTGMSGGASQPSGLSSNALKEVQQKLHAEGLYRGRIDGKEGPATKQALSQFQQKHGLQATGTLDQETLAALNASPSAGAGSSMAPSGGQGGGGMTPRQGRGSPSAGTAH
jgi:peptidoglycan hydrolase-like protein with peptidoglycan-binding domain